MNPFVQVCQGELFVGHWNNILTLFCCWLGHLLLWELWMRDSATVLFCYSKAWSHHACQANLLTSHMLLQGLLTSHMLLQGLAHVMLASQEILHNMATIQELRCQMAATQESLCKMAVVLESHVTSQLIFQSLFQWQLIFQSLVTSQLIVQSLTAKWPPCLSLIAKWPPRLSLIARWLLCLILWLIWSWFCSTVCLMVAARRVHGSGGRSLWWSSVLSSHIAGCRCRGARCSSSPTMCWAIWTLLCRAFRLRAVQFPYQAVMKPVSMLSTVQL